MFAPFAHQAVMSVRTVDSNSDEKSKLYDWYFFEYQYLAVQAIDIWIYVRNSLEFSKLSVFYLSFFSQYGYPYMGWKMLTGY